MRYRCFWGIPIGIFEFGGDGYLDSENGFDCLTCRDYCDMRNGEGGRGGG